MRIQIGKTAALRSFMREEEEGFHSSRINKSEKFIIFVNLYLPCNYKHRNQREEGLKLLLLNIRQIFISSSINTLPIFEGPFLATILFNLDHHHHT